MKLLVVILILLFPYSAHAQSSATDKLWNNETLDLDTAKLQRALAETPLSVEDGQKIGACMTELAPRLQAAAGQLPDAALQRDIANCYRGTALEPLLTPTYEKIATVIDCGKDKLGVERVADVTRLAKEPTDHEIEIIKTCYVERTAPAITAVAAINTIAVGGARNVGLLLYMGASHAWLYVRGRRRDKFGLVRNSLSHLPIDLAIVRLIDAKGATKKTAVTDGGGRYYLFSDPGEFQITVTKPGFSYPAQFPPQQTDISHELIYNEQRVTMTQQSPVLPYTLPVDPTVQEPSTSTPTHRRIRQRATSFIALAAPLAGVGTAALSITWWTAALAVANVVLYVLVRYFIRRHSPTRFGTVTDASGKPIPNIIIRIFETTYNKLVASVVTDRHGRYGALVGPGTYTVQYERPGSAAVSATRTISITHNSGVIAESITLS